MDKNLLMKLVKQVIGEMKKESELAEEIVANTTTNISGYDSPFGGIIRKNKKKKKNNNT